MNELDAIIQLKQGNIAGLEYLVQHYQTQAIRTAYFITRDQLQAEDVVQNAFIRCYERIAQFEANHPFGPWFIRSVINEASRVATRQKRQVSIDKSTVPEEDLTLADLLVDPGPEPTTLFEQDETRQEIWHALGQLSPQERAAIIQRYFFNVSEVAAATQAGCAPGTIKWRLHNARKHLRTLLSSPND